MTLNTTQLLQFLEQDLELPSHTIDLALRRLEQNPGPIPMVLWQYGLVSLEQLNQIYDYLETI
ncbi:DUF2949 domain-containing protein [Synechococcales cyanobacterium C]|uniref:DUF2949 domain-containing protein n=1 Tax=Petrachloros mirabilis ULC683 TaxID=2781853 RepID=A0A8K2A2H1_9CYAN|nr:DUF2949 domain-containing protein [Petrachloros mirabilis]NCJ08402.1 DUF2949 domain-containing protein [Petrachloros mirabilis ULC683]